MSSVNASFTSLRPARSSDDTGSSNQVTAARSTSCRPTRNGLLARVRPVGVDVQLDLVADDTPGKGDSGDVPRLAAPPRLPDLHLDPRDLPLLRPPLELGPCRRVVIGGKSTAAVERYSLGCPPEEIGQRDVQNLRLAIPQRNVDGGNGGADDAGPAEIPTGPHHGFVRGRDFQHAHVADGGPEFALNDAATGGRGVRPSEARGTAGHDLCRDDGRRVPVQRPVGLRLIGRHGVRT